MKNSELGELVTGIGKAVNEKLNITEKIINIKINFIIIILLIFMFMFIIMFKTLIETQTKLDYYMNEYGPTTTDIFILQEPIHNNKRTK